MEKRPSEVFLALWRFRTTHDDEETPEDFALCADAWRKIQSLEEIYAEASERARKQYTIPADKQWPEWRSQVLGQPVSRNDPAEDPTQVSFVKSERIDYQALMEGGVGHPDPAGEPGPPGVIPEDNSEESQPGEDPVQLPPAEGSPHYTGYMSRLKNETLSRLRILRRDKGLTSAQITEASGGKLTLNTVMDMLDAKQVPLAMWDEMKRALDKIEGIAGETAPPLKSGGEKE